MITPPKAKARQTSFQSKRVIRNVLPTIFNGRLGVKEGNDIQNSSFMRNYKTGTRGRAKTENASAA